MITTISGEAYKDVTPQDFNHYFASTAMVWRISPTKRRLFVVSGLGDGDKISGQYLTREKEFKDKTISLKEWWTSLDIILMQPIMFNYKHGAALWKHKLQKNLRKSFPWRFNDVKFFGDVPPAARTVQETASQAFCELYGMRHVKPALVDVWREGPLACWTRENFLIDRVANLLYFHSEPIGKFVTAPGVVESVVELYPWAAPFKYKLQKLGVLPENVLISEQKEKKDAKDASAIIPQAANPHYIKGYHPGYWLNSRWYSVLYVWPGSPHHGTILTYRGGYPGAQNLMPHYELHNMGFNDAI